MSSVEFEEIKPNNELNKLLSDNMIRPFRKGFGEFGPDKTVMPIYYKNIKDEIENFEVRDTDIFITSYPKTGTTWAQEMVWMITNNVDFEKGRELIQNRYSFLEITGTRDTSNVSNLNKSFLPTIEYISKLNNCPRYIKTHLPWSLLPKQIRIKEKQPKIIYTTRNAKDTCVSFHHHTLLFDAYTGEFETFCKLFLEGKLYYGHYWKHLEGYYQHKNYPNLLIIKFEDMKRDLPFVIRKTATFLNKTLSDQQVTALVHHLSFEQMKNNPAVNYNSVIQNLNNNPNGLTFMRAGSVGSYKKEMNEDMEEIFDKWIKEFEKKLGIYVN